jgi:arylsulfatase A-like enzyme
MQEPRDGPWLMSVNPIDPHPAFDALTGYRNQYDTNALPPPLFAEADLEVQRRLAGFTFRRGATRPGERQQENKANYYGDISLIDEQVGRVLDALEESGQRENTVVVFASDHGEMLGDHGLTAKGCRFYEGAVRVPLILSWPGHFEGGLVADGLVELTDLAPTLADLAHIPLEWTHGQSLLPILTGQAAPDVHHSYVRCEYYDTVDHGAPFEPGKHTPSWATMYRDDRFKLVVYHGIDYGELYDLEHDPDEFDNLWEQPDRQAIKHELIKQSFDASIVISDPGPPLIGRY